MTCEHKNKLYDDNITYCNDCGIEIKYEEDISTLDIINMNRQMASVYNSNYYFEKKINIISGKIIKPMKYVDLKYLRTNLGFNLDKVTPIIVLLEIKDSSKYIKLYKKYIHCYMDIYKTITGKSITTLSYKEKQIILNLYYRIKQWYKSNCEVINFNYILYQLIDYTIKDINRKNDMLSYIHPFERNFSTKQDKVYERCCSDLIITYKICRHIY